MPWNRSSPAFVSSGCPLEPTVETTRFSKLMWKNVTSKDSLPPAQRVLSPISPERARSGSRMRALSASRMFGAAGLKLLLAET